MVAERLFPRPIVVLNTDVTVAQQNSRKRRKIVELVACKLRTVCPYAVSAGAGETLSVWLKTNIYTLRRVLYGKNGLHTKDLSRRRKYPYIGMDFRHVRNR